MKIDESFENVVSMWKGNIVSYMIGFGACFLMTTLSFLLVAVGALPPMTLFFVVLSIAFVQAVIQLRFFLHLGTEGKPHWETWVFLFMLMILVFVFVGSLWVMWDLNARMM